MDKYKKKTPWIVGSLILAFAVIPYIVAAIYALPAADDLTILYSIRGVEGPFFTRHFEFAKSIYMLWQGTFWGNYIEGFSPINNAFTSYKLNIMLLIVLICFCFIIGFSSYYFCKTFFRQNKSIAFVLASLVVLLCLNGHIKRELLLWHTAVCQYTIPFLCGLIAVIWEVMLLRNKQGKNRRRICAYVCVTLLAFLASGGVLQSTGFFCWLFLLIMAICFMKKENLKLSLVIFVSALSGALINVAAPGNYLRQDNTYSRISLFKGGYYAVIAVANEVKYLFSSTFFPWILLLVIILAFVYMEKTEQKLFHPVIVGIAVLLSWIISTFPVCYGYADTTLAARGYELLDIFVVFGLLIFILSIVNWLKNKGINISKESIVVVVLLSIINIGYISNISFTNIPSVQCMRQFMSGELHDYHNEWISILTQIEASEDNNVEVPITQKSYETQLVIMSPGLSTNNEKWVNKGVAAILHKDSIRLKIEDRVEED